MENEYKTDQNNLFVNDFMRLLTSMYKKAHSDAIRRGLKAKRLQKAV
jgi:hypothetical protein